MTPVQLRRSAHNEGPPRSPLEMCRRSTRRRRDSTSRAACCRAQTRCGTRTGQDAVRCAGAEQRAVFAGSLVVTVPIEQPLEHVADRVELSVAATALAGEAHRRCVDGAGAGIGARRGVALAVRVSSRGWRVFGGYSNRLRFAGSRRGEPLRDASRPSQSRSAAPFSAGGSVSTRDESARGRGRSRCRAACRRAALRSLAR